MKNLKQEFSLNRGITMMSLIITIVILLILSTITINAVFGENRINKTSTENKRYGVKFGKNRR